MKSTLPRIAISSGDGIFVSQRTFGKSCRERWVSYRSLLQTVSDARIIPGLALYTAFSTSHICCVDILRALSYLNGLSGNTKIMPYDCHNVKKDDPKVS